MKKFYSAMALALAVGVSANAAGHDLENAQAQQLLPRQNVSVLDKSVSAPSQTQATAPQKILDFKTVEDLYGVYFMASIIPLTNQPQGYQNFSLQIIPDPDGDPNYVGLIGIALDIPMRAEVDLKNQTLTVKKQLAFHSSYYNVDVYGTPAKWNAAGDGFVDADSYVLRYYPNGKEIDVTDNNGKPTGEKETILKGWLAYNDFEDLFLLPVMVDGKEGYFWATYANQCYDLDKINIPVNKLFPAPFKFDAAEWEDKGTAQFTDGFFSPILKEPIPAYTVNVKQNKANPNLVVLVDPYGKGTAFEQINESEESGYIMLDVSNPELVKVVPMVYSGFRQEGDYYYFANTAGTLALIEGKEDADIIDYLDMMGYEMPTYSTDEPYIANIYDGEVSFSYSLFQYSAWTDDEDEALPMESVIEFSEKVGGVEGIINDVDVNAPTTYYNLQGARVAAPAKGDLVIVKKGGKSTKAIF